MFDFFASNFFATSNSTLQHTSIPRYLVGAHCLLIHVPSHLQNALKPIHRNSPFLSSCPKPSFLLPSNSRSSIKLSKHTPPSPHHATCLLPLSFLRCKMRRPVLLRVLLSQPCLRFCTSLVCPFMVFRGPKRSCMPCRAGCAETAVAGTTSAEASDDDVVVGEGVKEEEVAVVGRKVDDRVGRRGERHVYVLGTKDETNLLALRFGGCGCSLREWEDWMDLPLGQRGDARGEERPREADDGVHCWAGERERARAVWRFVERCLGGDLPGSRSGEPIGRELLVMMVERVERVLVCSWCWNFWGLRIGWAVWLLWVRGNWYCVKLATRGFPSIGESYKMARFSLDIVN